MPSRKPIEVKEIHRTNLRFLLTLKGADDSGIVRLVAEVKTTLPDKQGRIRSPQKTQIKKDLDRLAGHQGDVLRYLVVLSSSTKRAIERQLKTDRTCPKVKITNAFDEEMVEAR